MLPFPAFYRACFHFSFLQKYDVSNPERADNVSSHYLACFPSRKQLYPGLLSAFSCPHASYYFKYLGWRDSAGAHFHRLCSACIFRLTSRDRKSTRLNSSHGYISYAVFCLKKKKKI